jgi:hypothetical protein
MGLVTGAVAWALSGCGGQPNEVDPKALDNTGLAIEAITGLKAYTFGAAQRYSVTVVDPDGIKAVSVTLDGLAIPVSVSGAQYAITLPADTPIGPHTLVVRATGTAPDGSSEVPQSVTQVITVVAANTPLKLSPLSGPKSYSFGPAQGYRVTVTDPDGISSVLASLDGTSIPAMISGGDYLVTVPAGTAPGDHLLRVSATGIQPDGSVEPVQTVEQLVSILPVAPVDTPLYLSAVTETGSAGLSAIFNVTVGDPDGIASVSATFDGTPMTLTAAGSNYSFSMYYYSAHPGPHTVVFTAVGRAPDGSPTSPVSVSYFIP